MPNLKTKRFPGFLPLHTYLSPQPFLPLFYPTPYPIPIRKVILLQIQYHITSLTYMQTDSINVPYFQLYFICSLLAVRVTNSFQFTGDCPGLKTESPTSRQFLHSRQTGTVSHFICNTLPPAHPCSKRKTKQKLRNFTLSRVLLWASTCAESQT